MLYKSHGRVIDMKLSRSSLGVKAILCLLALGLILAMAIFSGSQDTGFQIKGRVLDASGARVQGAQVSIQPSNSSIAMDVPAVSTDDDGRFTIDGLPEGDYLIIANYDGHTGTDTAHLGPSRNLPPIRLLDLNIVNIPSPTPDAGDPQSPTPSQGDNAPPSTPPSSGDVSHNSQVKYAQTSYNMAPIIQMNTSWKRAAKFEPLIFDAGNTYDPDGYVMAYEWTFGDGSMAEGKTVQHSYTAVGSYSVKLRVVDNSGGERFAYVMAIISNKPPVAMPGNDTNATVGETVQFNGTGSYDPDGRIVKYEWNFGDGASGQGISVTHVYSRPDKYKAELKVTDDSGANGTAYRAVDVATVSAAAPQAKSGGSQGILLLAGVGVACVAVIILTRKKGK